MDEALIQRINSSIAAPPPSSPASSSPAPAQAQPQAQSAPTDTSDVTKLAGGAGLAINLLREPGKLKDAVVGGARDALQSTWDTFMEAGRGVAQGADRAGLNVLGLPVPKDGEKFAQLPEVPRADESTTAGTVTNVARDLERFVLGLVGGGMALRGAGIATNTFKGASAAGFIGDFMVTGAGDSRLVDLFEKVPGLQGPMLEALSTDGNDNLWAHKFAAATEGMLFGGALEGTLRLIGVSRKYIAAKKAGDDKGAEKIAQEAIPELEQAAKEIKGWHGSPHDFDQFELRPRTGEGTEAFGRGVYIAENEKVGRYYRNSTAGSPPILDKVDELIDSVTKGASVEDAIRDFPTISGVVVKRPELARDLEIAAQGMARDGVGFAEGQSGRDGKAAYDRVQKIMEEEFGRAGTLYGVNVKHSVDELLDWDAPLKGQAVEPKLRAIAEKIEAGPHGNAPSTANFVKALRGEEQSQFNLAEATGEQFYRTVSTMLGGDEAASAALKEAGIPGHRFLDAGSRDAGAGTRNMVLFDPSSVEITSKNGVPVTKQSGKPVEVSPSGQIELFPEVVRREDAIHDIQLQIKGDRYIDPETGKEKILPISNRAREELTSAFKDPSSPLHIDKLTPETREELLRALSSDSEVARFFNPKTVRGKPFALDDARRADFEKALENSLTVPYATLKAMNPGTAIEDTLSTFLNYRYMDSADSVKVVLDDMAEVMRPMVQKHLGGPGPQTFDTVREMADWIGSKPDTLAALMSQQARAAEYMPAMVVAAKTWVQSLARDITEISKQIASGTATDTAKIELVRRQDILADLISTLKAVQTSGARTTAAGRIRTADALTHEEIGTLIKEVGEDNFKYLSRRLSLTEGDPKAVISLLEPSFVQKSFGVLNEYWINGLLSGWPTHVVNLVGGARNTFLYPLFRITGGALTGDMASVRLGMGQYAGLRSALFDSLEMSKRALLTENAYVDASFHQIERERLWVKAETFGLDGGDWLGRGIDYLGTAIRMPSRFLTSSDEFLKQLNYRASVTSRATEEAMQRGLSDTKMVPYLIQGEKRMVSEVQEYVLDRMNEAFHPRLEHGLDEKALADARRATFTQPLREATWYNGPTLGEMVQQAAAKIPPVRHVLLPFVRVPVNIFREMVYESPAAPLRAQFWEAMKQGGEARADAVGRLAIGSTFWTAASMLALEGVITGKGPSDPQLNKQWRAAGNQPYSIRFAGQGPDGKDLFISYNRLDPWSGMLGIAADAAYIMAHVDERTQDQLAATLTLSLANNLNSRGYLRSLTELTAVIGQANSPTGAAAAQRWLNSRASSYVPRIVSSFNSDDTLREARTMVEALESKIPGLSAALPPQRDHLGWPIVPAVGWPFKEVNPFVIGIGKDGKARRELAYWAESPVRAQFELPHSSLDGVIDLRDFKNAKTGQNAYDRWLEVLTEKRFGGKTMEERMDDIVSSEGYKNAKKQGVENGIFRRHPAAEFLREKMNEHYEVAKNLMLKEKGFEELAKALAVYDANKNAVPAGGQRIVDPTLEQLLKDKR